MNLKEKIFVSEEMIRVVGTQFLAAIKEAGRIYRHIEETKASGDFVTEVSMDESDTPQTPIELLFILAGLARENIPVQTIAPRFSGRFNKGVDYAGDIVRFASEFERDLCFLAFAKDQFGLPSELKLSVHSGSDKFAIYGPIKNALKKFNAGLHLKTAGTTWLEEIIGLAEAGGEGLSLAKEIYSRSFERMDELCAPYATVIDIYRGELPEPGTVYGWDGNTFASTLRHDQSCKLFNSSFRQLLHVAYKIAAELGEGYLKAMDEHNATIAENVTTNIYARHLAPLFC